MSGDSVRDEHDNDLATPLGKACARLFGPRIDAEEIDVVELVAENAVEIQADEWTLHMQGEPIALAFIAIEDEPEQASALTPALRMAITPDDLAGLRSLDTELDGTLVARLASSGDPLSQALATLLTEGLPPPT